MNFSYLPHKIEYMVDPITMSDSKKIITRFKSKYCQLWGIKPVKDEIVVEFSSRITRSLGRTQPAAKIIRLNPLLQTSLNHLLEEVLCHELAHVAAFHLNGDAIRPHGPEWQTLVLAAGFEPRVRIEADLNWPSSLTVRCYTHRCPVCHAVRVAKRPMARWRCSECVASGLTGELQIEGEK
mgnify:CR=1 FL=1